jgi:heterodisulfide reductase subunit A
MTRGVLVLGGGVAGLQAALDLADAGIHVYLVERTPSIGGNMIRLDKTFPTNDCSSCILSPRLVEAGRHPRITLLTNSDLVSLDGGPGAFTAHVRERPRYIDMDVCVACGDCTIKCPSKVPSEFDEGLSMRKAVYIPFPQAVPLKYVIDPEHCLKIQKDKCGLCEKFCQAKAVDYEQQPVDHELDVGAVIVATGYKQIDTSIRPEYGHGRLKDVITGMELERLLNASGPTGGKVLRPSDGEVPKRVAFIHCAMSRDERRGASHCSRVCCMYLVKEAMVSKEHHPEIEATMVHMDLRAYGKGYDAYLERAEEDGITFVRGRAAEVVEDGEGGLIVVNEDEDGNLSRIGADMVVLGVALVPPEGNDGLVESLGLEVDERGFIATAKEDPSGLRSTRPGVLLAGCIQGPKDVPDSVSMGSAAASAAAATLHDQKETMEPEEVPETDPTEEARVGVFVCHCGSNIAGVVDCAAVSEYARGLPGVTHTEENIYTCSQDSQVAIAETIEREGINRVVIAACSPSTHEPLFQATLRDAGIDPHLIDMANIRNQCSWTHAKEPEAATEKSKDLVRASIARARELEPLGGGTEEVPRKALVIGGGVGGLAAALSLAPHAEVTLVERREQLGGTIRQLATSFPSGLAGGRQMDMLEGMVRDAGVKLLTGAELLEIGGYVGSFQYRIRKADGSETEDNAGVVILALGSQPYEPAEGEFGRGAPNVVTNLELEDELSDPPTGLSYVFIQCVGSRNDERGCSRYCCQATLQQARELAEAGNSVTVLYRDIRAYSAQGEDAYRAAREAGVLYVRYEPEWPPEVLDDGKRVRFRETIVGRTLERSFDKVVLVVGLRPPEGLQELRGQLRVPGDQEGFLMERHPKLGPVETNTEGIYLAGSCQAPMAGPEAAIAGSAAAMKALGPLSRGWVATETKTSEINRDTCIGCGLCVLLCPYHAIDKDEENRAKVNTALCEGCGLCAASCPTQSISVRHFRDSQLKAQLHALVGGDDA